MTQSRRILLNIVATYGRSLFSLVVGLFTSRWVLDALGTVDFGLYGVVGGLVVFVEFINGLLKASTSRFYAYSVGKAGADEFSGRGLRECQKWFSLAVIVHTAIPIVLVIFGYTIGIYAIKNWFVIPPDRVLPCIWVFRFACIACFVSMVNVPFAAMYIAKQYIAELTIYSFCQTFATFVFVYIMTLNSGDWLTRYALWMCVMSIVPQIIIAVRAVVVFKECRFQYRLARDIHALKQFCNFAFWQAFGNLGFVIKTQGMQMLINKFFGPTANAAMSIANRVAAQSQALTISMQGAFAPAITSACGSGDLKLMRALSYRSCKFGLLLSIVFMLPLAIELPYVLTLWLANVPDNTIDFCRCILVVMIIDKASVGHGMAVAARGKIALYQLLVGMASIVSLPVAYCFVKIGHGILSICGALILTTTMATLGRVWFARSLVGLSFAYWARRIVLPVGIIIGLAIGLGVAVRIYMECSLFRLFSIAAICEVVILPMAWMILLDKSEREYLIGKISNRFSWAKRGV